MKEHDLNLEKNLASAWEKMTENVIPTENVLPIDEWQNDLVETPAPQQDVKEDVINLLEDAINLAEYKLQEANSNEEKTVWAGLKSDLRNLQDGYIGKPQTVGGF